MTSNYIAGTYFRRYNLNSCFINIICKCNLKSENWEDLCHKYNL